MGFIDEQTGVTLLGFPDVERTKNLLATTTDYADWAVEQLFDGKDPPIPMPAVTHLPTVLARLGQHFLQATMDGAQEEDLDSLRKYIESVAREVAAIGKARETLAAAEEAKKQQQQAAQQGGGAPSIAAMEGGPA
jgi:hypothetical protein